MVRRTTTLLGAVLLGLLAVLVAFVVGMRARSPRLLNAVRRMNRAVVNPVQLRSAGTPGAHAAVIRHDGRTSGRPYQTPVGAVPTDDGFVIALVYGPHTDWLKNVLASGSATIVHEGRSHRVDQPEVIPLQAVAGYLSANDQRNLRLIGVDRCLRVRRVQPGEAAERGGEPTGR
jgi:deazaflavin-dependent oxidoreductase (nitroreductase family)